MSASTFAAQLREDKPIIAMIHLRPLPGTPGFAGDLTAVVETAVEEARIYHQEGVDALAVENMHDTPYLRGTVGPEITAAITVVGREVKRAVGLPCGVQILAGANREAVAAAQAAGLDFIRAEGFVFAHVADEGIFQSCAGELLRYRRQIGAERVLVLADIKKKHGAHAITNDVSIVETARAAELFRGDGVIVTGRCTGEATDLAEVQQVRDAVSIPVLVGSGVTLDNVERYLAAADALIVGSWFKRDARWNNEVEPDRVARLMERVRRFRARS